MATKKHRPKKARKSRKGGAKSHRKGRRKKGLSGTSTAARAMSMKQALVETGKTTGGTLIGLLGSAALGYGIDKIGFIQVKETDGKIVSILKKSVKPVSLVLLGGTTAVIARKKGIKFLAAIGDGVTIGGAFSGVKSIVGSKTALFSGLGSADQSNAANYYQESLEEMKKVLNENKKLMKLHGFEEGENGQMSGTSQFPATDMNLETSSSFL